MARILQTRSGNLAASTPALSTWRRASQRGGRTPTRVSPGTQPALGLNLLTSEVDMTPRRKFLATCGACAIAGLAPGALLAAMRPGGGACNHANKGHREQFLAFLGGSFQFFDPASGAGAGAVLAEVRSGPSTPKLEQFSLLFSADPGTTLAEGIYRVTGPGGRTLDLFVIPGTHDGGAQLLRAEFGLIV